MNDQFHILNPRESSVRCGCTLCTRDGSWNRIPTHGAVRTVSCCVMHPAEHTNEPNSFLSLFALAWHLAKSRGIQKTRKTHTRSSTRGNPNNRNMSIMMISNSFQQDSADDQGASRCRQSRRCGELSYALPVPASVTKEALPCLKISTRTCCFVRPLTRSSQQQQ